MGDQKMKMVLVKLFVFGDKAIEIGDF